MRRGVAATVVGLSVVAALAACTWDPAEPATPVSSYGEGPRPAASDDVRPVASGRALAAIAISHLRSDQVDSIGGFGGASGTTVLIGIDGPGSTLYVSTVSPEYGTERGTCAGEGRQLSRGYRLLSCVQTDDSLTTVTSSGAGGHHAVLGSRVTDQGRTGAWVEPATNDGEAQRLIEDLLSDSRLAYRTTSDAMALGEDLDDYEDMKVTTEFKQVH